MKRFLRYSFLLLILIFTSLQASWNATIKGGLPVSLSICDHDLSQEKVVFKTSFRTAYQGTEIENMVQKKHGSLDHFLDVAFEDDETDFLAKKSATLFISAKNQNGEVIGFVSFDKHQASDSDLANVYVRSLAILPQYQHKNLGAILMYSFLNIWPDYHCVKLVTRRLNASAVGFYTKMGFKDYGYVHEGFDPSVYVGFTRLFDDAFARTMLGLYTYVN